MNKQKSSGGKILKGVVFILLGLIIWLWVRGHSPHMDFGEMLSNMDNWMLKEPFYSVVIIFAALLVLTGAVELYRGLRSEQKADSGADNNAHIFCSECGTQCPANTAFCNKCGNKIGGG